MDVTGKKRGEIESFYALKAIAFIGVFLGHSWITLVPISGMCAVSIFLVLSGFLYTYRYFDKDSFIYLSIKELLVFTIKKLKWLWVLQIITTVSLIPFCVFGEVADSTIGVILKVLVNVLMLNGWLPIPELSINRVSWYMSSQALCVFMFPLIIKRIRKNTLRDSRIAIIKLLILELLLVVAFTYFKKVHFFKYQISYEWALYTFPFVRIIDFLLGCNVGAVYILQTKNDKLKELRKWNAFALFSLVVTIAVNYLSALVVTGKITTTVFMSMFAYNAVFALPVCVLVYVFARGNNVVTDALTNRITIRIGKLSPYMFLIHNVVFEYLGRALWRIAGEESYLKYRILVNCTAGIIFTSILAWIYLVMVRRLKKQ